MHSKFTQAALLSLLLLKVLLTWAAEVPNSLNATVDRVSRGPEWLANVPFNSQVVKSRKRRFIQFPTGTTLKTTFLFTVPVAGVGDSVAPVTVQQAFTINLPTAATSTGITGRMDASQPSEDLLTQFENYVGGFGLDGHACTLRAICEIAEQPFDHGIAGELINVLLTLVGTMGGSDYDAYSTAEYYGRHHGDCKRLYPLCSTSITDFISNVL